MVYTRPGTLFSDYAVSGSLDVSVLRRRRTSRIVLPGGKQGVAVPARGSRRRTNWTRGRHTRERSRTRSPGVTSPTVRGRDSGRKGPSNGRRPPAPPHLFWRLRCLGSWSCGTPSTRPGGLVTHRLLPVHTPPPHPLCTGPGGRGLRIRPCPRGFRGLSSDSRGVEGTLVRT